MTHRMPETKRGQALFARMSAARWEAVVEEALQKAAIVEAVQAHRDRTEESWKRCLQAVSPEVGWSKYLHWRRRYVKGEGPAWERLVDSRIPPLIRISEDVARAARALRRADRSITARSARELLQAEFGPDLAVSDASLGRIWAAADLRRVRKSNGPSGSQPGEVVETFHGGGGLALLLAADAETGSSLRLAQAVLDAGAGAEAGPETAEPRKEDDGTRDAHGRFTGEYNAQWREGVAPGERDARWNSDADKRATRNLEELPLVKHRPETLARKLLCMGSAALISERRGFDGLDGPSGSWLGVFGGTAYMPATLDKALAQLGLLSADTPLWDAHAALWATQSQRWSKGGPAWLQTALYIDGTSDPYWTRKFALSGKVERVGRVMPNLSRVAVASGAGVPLLVETHVGTVGLKKRLGPLLERLDSILGLGGDAGRLTIVDSEAGTAGAMWALHSISERVFVTVLKGPVRKGARVHGEGEWVAYRDRDEIREVEIDLKGKGAPPAGLTVRGVEMRRTGRNPVTTLFATNAVAEDLDTATVVDAYLARWPAVEQLFRDARNGIGLNRNHGYGDGEVTHVALETNLERADKSVAHAKACKAAADATRAELNVATEELEASARNKALALADKAATQAEARLVAAKAKKARLDTMPTTIYQRDTTRDSVMTCLKFNLCMLVEFVLREYLGSAATEWRNFIEQFVELPVTVRTTNTRRCFEIHANPRQPQKMAQLADAIQEINARKIRQDGRLLVFKLREPPAKARNR